MWFSAASKRGKGAERENNRIGADVDTTEKNLKKRNHKGMMEGLKQWGKRWVGHVGPTREVGKGWGGPMGTPTGLTLEALFFPHTFDEIMTLLPPPSFYFLAREGRLGEGKKQGPFPHHFAPYHQWRTELLGFWRGMREACETLIILLHALLSFPFLFCFCFVLFYFIFLSWFLPTNTNSKLGCIYVHKFS